MPAWTPARLSVSKSCRCGRTTRPKVCTRGFRPPNMNCIPAASLPSRAMKFRCMGARSFGGIAAPISDSAPARKSRIRRRRSMKFKWTLAPPQPLLAGQLACRLNIPPLLAQCLLNRGLSEPSAIESFLQPRLKTLADPFLLPDMEKAVGRLLRARERQERLVIFGDYDVDGVASTALLLHVLRPLGWHVDFYLPGRMDEGYGLSAEGVENCLNKFPATLLLAVDSAPRRWKRLPPFAPAALTSWSWIIIRFPIHRPTLWRSLIRSAGLFLRRRGSSHPAPAGATRPSQPALRRRAGRSPNCVPLVWPSNWRTPWLSAGAKSACRARRRLI